MFPIFSCRWETLQVPGEEPPTHNTENKAPQDTARGAAAYTRTNPAIYDLFVLGFSNTFAWKCPSRVIVDHYNRHVTDRHLDVGVGTGYFLDKCRFPGAAPAVALMDLNPNSLQATARRLWRYRPECVRADVLRPVGTDLLDLHDLSDFSSIGMSYLLHCLPGTLRSKNAVFANLKPLLRSGGVLFGATILGEGVKKNLSARTLSAICNRKGIFSNSKDSLPDLEAVLAVHFVDTQVRMEGCVALFSGKKK